MLKCGWVFSTTSLFFCSSLGGWNIPPDVPACMCICVKEGGRGGREGEREREGGREEGGGEGKRGGGKGVRGERGRGGKGERGEGEGRMKQGGEGKGKKVGDRGGSKEEKEGTREGERREKGGRNCGQDIIAHTSVQMKYLHDHDMFSRVCGCTQDNAFPFGGGMAMAPFIFLQVLKALQAFSHE